MKFRTGFQILCAAIFSFGVTQQFGPPYGFMALGVGLFLVTVTK